MLVGYARTSTADQKAGLEAQLRELRAAGCDKIYEEQVSSLGRRDELEAALEFVRSGDTLMVTKLCRLARSVPDLVRIVGLTEKKGVGLKILSMNLDTSSPTGRLLINLVGAISQFEREILLERQREGIQAAQKEGKYKGRAPTARAQSDQVLRLWKSGKGATEIADLCKVSRASVYRIVAGVPRPIPGGPEPSNVLRFPA